jgi:methionyl-tRNA formyltransferase
MINIIKYQISKSSKILFMGSDNFANLPLQALHKNFKNLEVVTHHTK